MADNERPRFGVMRLLTDDELRSQQGKLVDELVTDAERGTHIHAVGGGQHWCNWDPTCEDSRPISELLV